VNDPGAHRLGRRANKLVFFFRVLHEEKNRVVFSVAARFRAGKMGVSSVAVRHPQAKPRRISGFACKRRAAVRRSCGVVREDIASTPAWVLRLVVAGVENMAESGVSGQGLHHPHDRDRIRRFRSDFSGFFARHPSGRSQRRPGQWESGWGIEAGAPLSPCGRGVGERGALCCLLLIESRTRCNSNHSP